MLNSLEVSLPLASPPLRENAHRGVPYTALPKTIDYFEKLSNRDQFRVFDFKFFGTLGAYSPPNRYAFFSGYPLADDQVTVGPYVGIVAWLTARTAGLLSGLPFPCL